MFLNNTSVDAVITDKYGKSLEVDCRVTEPIVSGSPALISIEIPLVLGKQHELANPCTLIGKDGSLEVEIGDIWYHSIPLGLTYRKHARGKFNINYVGSLWIKESYLKSDRARIRFLLSPIRFFKKHICVSMVNYADTPEMTAEIFKLHTAELGDIRFIKYWSVHHVDKNGIAAEIHAGFAAEIKIQESTTPSMEQLIEKMKDILLPLSILTRQAITLHGWIWEKQEGIETMWFNPLDPNLAPDMAEEPVENVCFPQEFNECAQSLVEKFIGAPPEIKEAITLISVALAPHVRRSTAGNFSALFGALEQVIGLKKLTKEEKERLRETDEELISALNDLKVSFEKKSTPNGEKIARRIEGFQKNVRDGGASLSVRFEKFQAAYPNIKIYMTDIWPIFGTSKTPGLKNIRDSLAHGLQADYSAQAIAVAHWHFSRLAERLAFILLGINVPRGIHFNSSLLSREQWYDRSYWEAIRTSAKCKSA